MTKKEVRTASGEGELWARKRKMDKEGRKTVRVEEMGKEVRDRQ